MDGTTRLLIVAAGAAAAFYFFGPQISGAFRDAGRQMQGALPPALSSVVTQTMRLDPTVAKAPVDNRRVGLGRLGAPEGGPQGGMPPWEDAGSDPGEGGAYPDAGGGGYPHVPRGRPYRRYRDCEMVEHRLRCGPWHDGPAPDERRGGGRW